MFAAFYKYSRDWRNYFSVSLFVNVASKVCAASASQNRSLLLPAFRFDGIATPLYYTRFLQNCMSRRSKVSNERSTKSRGVVDFIVNKLAIPTLRRLYRPVFIHRLTLHYSVERSIFGRCFPYCRSIYSPDLRTSEKHLDLSFLPGLCFFLSIFTLFLSSLAAPIIVARGKPFSP